MLSAKFVPQHELMGSAVNHFEAVIELKRLLQIVSFAVEREDRETERQHFGTER